MTKNATSVAGDPGDPFASEKRLRAMLKLSDEYWSRISPEEREQYAIVRPLPDANYAVDVHINNLERHLAEQHEDCRRAGGGLEMDPDFQRGHKWSVEQRSRYIESLMRGQAPTRLMFNCPSYGNLYSKATGDIPHNAMQCIDGLQRATAVIGWMRGEVKAFGGRTVDDFRNGPFDPRRLRVQFVVYNFAFKRDLLQFYLDLNSGGVVHSPEELARVQALLAATNGPQRVRQIAGPVDRGDFDPLTADLPGHSEPANRPRERG